MKDLFAFLVIVTMLVLACRYIYQIHRHKITPTLSTWIIFFIGTGLSLLTYALAEKHDFKSGILSVMDTAAVASILCAILVWGNRDMRFKPFEKWYLVGVGAIISYGLISGDARGSNIFTQVLISVGYVPTIQNLITEKKNTESFTAWGCALTAGIFGLYPALVEDGNSLAAIYSIRTIILVFIMLCLMAYYEFSHNKPAAARR